MLAKNVERGTVDLVLADPPYGNIVSDKYDKVTSNTLVSMLIELSRISIDILKPGGSLIVFGGIGTYKNRPMFEFLSKAEEIKDLYIRDIITWKKNKGYGSSNRYLFTREEMAWITKGENPSYFMKPYLNEKHSKATVAMLKNAKYKTHSSYKRRSNVWTDIKEIMRGKIVSAQKPTLLYDVLIKTHCPELGLIVDMFGGSGNSAVSAKENNRSIVIYEKDPDVYKLMIDNIEKNRTLYW